MSAVWWPARSGSFPAQAARAALGEAAGGVRRALQLLVRGGGLPEAAHAAVGALSRAPDLPRRDRRARDSDAARARPVAAEPAARGARGEQRHARAVANVVAGGVRRERVLEGREGGVLAAGLRSRGPALAARAVRGRRPRAAGGVDALHIWTVDAGPVRPGSTFVRAPPTKITTRRGG